jgi:ElaB/YqjD/DUF883 family membrane-anchored ribosome-binding protein
MKTESGNLTTKPTTGVAVSDLRNGDERDSRTSTRFIVHELFLLWQRVIVAHYQEVCIGLRALLHHYPFASSEGNNMDDPKKSLESMGEAAAGVTKQVSDTAADAKEKLTDLGRDAAGQLSEAAQAATDKIKAAADYLRETEVAAMADDVKDIVKRYPGWSLAAAAVVGFFLANLRSRD